MRARIRSLSFDLVLALFLTAIIQVQMWTVAPPNELAGGAGSAFALLQSVPLIWRRRRPWPVFLVVLVSSAVPPVLGGLGDNAFSLFGVLIGLYTLAAYRNPKASVSGLVIGAFLGTILHQLPNMKEFDPGFFTTLGLGLIGAWFLGFQVRLRRRYAAALEDRQAELEREQQRSALEAIVGERARLARELHDVIGHSLSVIAVQSGAARLYFDSRPEQARQVLSSVEKVAREANQEMARMLKVMAGEAPQESGDPVSLEHIDELVERVKRTGLEVAIRKEGDPRRLSAGLELSAFRILQEALTNAIKHGGSRAQVLVRYGATDLELEVTNEAKIDSPAAAPPLGGQGLVGMRERVALFNGQFTAAATSEGYSVKARIPIEVAG